MSGGQRVGVVLIGRNEGPRLVRALGAAVATGCPVVYVDSNSTDGSCETAAGFGVSVLRFSEGPFTAARGRQAGADLICASHASLEYVQFVDGDCILQPGWLDLAIGYMDSHARCGAVTGRRREEHAGAQFWARLIDLDWQGTPGPAGYPGGDSLCRVVALREIGGWRTSLIAGEDPDLGFRMRDAGWDVQRLADEMTLHDMRMTSFTQYWRRAVRSGHAYAEVGWAHRRGSGHVWFNRVVAILMYSVLLPLVIAGVGMYSVIAGCVLVLVYLRAVLAMARSCRRKGASPGTSLAYAALNLICKWACAYGIWKYLLARVTGRSVPLIEYNRPVPAACGAHP